MKFGSISSGGGLPLLVGFGIGAGVGIVCRYYYSEEYFIPYVEQYVTKTDVLIPAGIGIGGLLIGLIMKSNTKYALLGIGIGGISTAAVNYFLPKTETSYRAMSNLNSCCGMTVSA